MDGEMPAAVALGGQLGNLAAFDFPLPSRSVVVSVDDAVVLLASLLAAIAVPSQSIPAHSAAVSTLILKTRNRPSQDRLRSGGKPADRCL